MKIIIFGPQGSGKGTQAELIARHHGWSYISTGDIFRYHLKNQTALGKKVDKYVSSGLLAPDELTNEIVKDRIFQPDCVSGFVLDGYPRNLAQLEFLNKIAKIDFALAIELSDEEAIKRLADRWACKCGLSYHLLHNPPKEPGICDKCGLPLFRRDDDKPEAIKKRLEIFHQETEPLFAVYNKSGIWHQVNGDQPINEVYRQIDDAIHHHLG
ncbi:MAG: adenylate kinase [Candidatus Buchananbacteria bacterium RIFCSPHIGHO2_02_FULL_45_11b]|uniref:Adenylate kinase n=4 Tax=Candidatus Buchananiibacteriota TaxID=1817903 RepID=A0A1G1YPW4_9BACT|nr:MAG: adenylate kinase [Candidatus Buchananbacteria bacterium RIFCSPHIGHO2_01_FULL_46_12]OGY50483.1 MAG: adenylate kinase [Candidatus Buchananbacteria bacterium RIFCSPHIGHO2_02_FULL_45_11b]OGY53467.1 MAG: adenylate kinase [Candidatus Buchananbacteria bacterium RIFCSPLOWO2_01_FULL_45_31]OGY57060.1 MAG: adenylate kinase [Candidatus Buchananbacteria bacterium RIFCSPLOWO2_02_FULL_46_11b]